MSEGTISKKTLEMVDESAKNMKDGKVSEPISLPGDCELCKKHNEPNDVTKAAIEESRLRNKYFNAGERSGE